MSVKLSEFDQRYGVLYKEMELIMTQANCSAELHLAPESISDGRLRFISNVAFDIASPGYIAVQFFGRSFDVVVNIISCEKSSDGFKLELEITEEIALKARILLQLAEIVHYRQVLLNKGRSLTIDEAAAEWIEQYAAGFAAEFEKHIAI